MKFEGEWMELENVILFEVNKIKKGVHGAYLLKSRY